MCNGFYNRQGASERELIRNTFTANQRRQGAEYDFNQPIQVPDIFFRSNLNTYRNFQG